MTQIPDHMEDVGQGWWPILAQLHDDIRALDPDYSVAQVKEKYGGLRVYLSTAEPDSIGRLIDEAEAASLRTCEECGQSGEPGPSRPGGYWIKTLCDAHRGYSFTSTEEGTT